MLEGMIRHALANCQLPYCLDIIVRSSLFFAPLTLISAGLAAFFIVRFALRRGFEGKPRLVIARTLSIFFFGVGHIYIGDVRRGQKIVIIGYIALFVLQFLFGLWGLLLLLPFWIWQIWDLGRRHRILHA